MKNILFSFALLFSFSYHLAAMEKPNKQDLLTGFEQQATALVSDALQIYRKILEEVPATMSEEEILERLKKEEDELQKKLNQAARLSLLIEKLSSDPKNVIDTSKTQAHIVRKTFACQLASNIFDLTRVSIKIEKAETHLALQINNHK